MQNPYKLTVHWLFSSSFHKLKHSRVNVNMELNLLKWVFSCLTILTVVMGYLINSMQKRLPPILNSAFRYGKFADVGISSQLKNIEIPKR